MENNHQPPPPPTPPPPPPVPSTTTLPASQENYNYAADLMIKQKKKAADATHALMQLGLDPQSASTVVGDLEVEIAKQKKQRAKRDMMYGGGICFVGLVITLVSYSVASETGGTYYVTWGAVLFGAIQFFRGLVNWRN